MDVNVTYIQDLIHSHNYSLGQLYVKSGLSKAQWSRILSGKRGIGTKSISAVLRVFPEADIEQIFLTKMLPNGSDKEGGKVDE